MKILIIDGQGGRVGRLLIEALRARLPQAEITAVGTNAMATQAMLKAGPHQSATGENSVVVCCRSAQLIVGPLGIVLADALLGEITPAMAAAVAQSPAYRLLLPFDQCSTRIAGMPALSMSRLVEQAVEDICRWAAQQPCPTAL